MWDSWGQSTYPKPTHYVLEQLIMSQTNLLCPGTTYYVLDQLIMS